MTISELQMPERKVSMRGVPVPLAGPALVVGDPAPDFLLHQRSPDGLRDVTLNDYAGKTLILSVVVSLDTPVCKAQTKRFNEEIIALPANVEALTVSMDLPYAQNRFATDEGIHHVSSASDHRHGSFGQAYGTLMPSLRLLARAVFVIAPDRTIRHAQIVADVTEAPDFEAALSAARLVSE